MSTENKLKINQLLSSHVPGTVLLSSFLSQHGYSLDLQRRYRKSEWLESIGSGAMIRSGDEVGFEGAVYALQKQAGLTIHPGGITALSLLGRAHFLELNLKKVQLFGGTKENLPKWFVDFDWGLNIEFVRSSFLPANVGLTDFSILNFTIKVSSLVRAFLECLYLVPQKHSFQECYQLMEGLNNLVPKEVQNLLELCNSIKVKRLFLFMAEKADHSWVDYLDFEKIDLGKGKRSIERNGIYDSKYKITIPSDLENG